MRALRAIILTPLTLAAAAGTLRADPQILDIRPTACFRSEAQGPAKLAPGEFYLYGDPATLEGRFEDANGGPDWQGWTTVDLTKQTDWSQVSTFNAENLNNHGPGNHALWIGQTAAQQPTWIDPPGYGNSWFTQIVWSSGPLADPAVGQTVQLDGYFNVDVEPGEDWFFIDYETGAGWQRVYSKTFSNETASGSGVFPPPGLRISDVLEAPIAYAGGDYGGQNGDEIRIRLVISTDGAYSSEDGYWHLNAGALQVDDLRVTYSDGQQTGLEDFTDFESPGPYSWNFDATPFVGDFARLWSGLGELDPCASNLSPQVAFIDDGRPPSNPEHTQILWTGGTTSPTWNYGSSGGWVVPRTTVFSENDPWIGIDNAVWSPPIAWDLPGTADDALDGVTLRFDHFSHEIIELGKFRTWNVRSSTDGGNQWGDWRNSQGVYAGGGPSGTYETSAFEIGDLIDAGATHIQVSLGVVAEPSACFVYGWPCDDTTPAPWYDNVQLIKHESAPTITAFDRHMFQDSFAVSGQDPLSASLDALACRFDMVDDRAPGSAIVPGDSMIVVVQPSARADSVVRAQMHWILDSNPLFDSVRVLPPGAVSSSGTAALGWDQWSGTIDGELVSSARSGRYAFDMPNEGQGVRWWQQGWTQYMFFPGDVLRFWFEAEDDLGRIAELPAERSGFLSGEGYEPQFTVRALPTLRSDGSGGRETPAVLLVDGAADPRTSTLYGQTFAQAGFIEGVDYDSYRVRAAQAGLNNSIGASGGPGATATELGGYSVLVLAAGRRADHVLSDGSAGTLNTDGDDLGVIENWMASPGARSRVFFGDHLVSAVAQASVAGQTFVDDSLRAVSLGTMVADELAGASSPRVEGTSPLFSTIAAVNGGCDQTPVHVGAPHPQLSSNGVRSFDAIGVLAPATATHLFHTAAATPPATNAVAGLSHRRDPGNGIKTDLTFSCDLEALTDPMLKGAATASARARLLQEALAYVGGVGGGIPVAGPPAATTAWSLEAFPNPSNPRTEFELQVARPGHYRVTIYDSRGSRIRRLYDGNLDVGAKSLRWDGVDDTGGPVASGVYHVLLEGAGVHATRKIALVR